MENTNLIDDPLSERSKDELIATSIKVNVEKLKSIFVFPTNSDFIIREIYIKSISENAVVFYLDGIIDNDILQRHIIEPLIENPLLKSNDEDSLTYLVKNVISAKNTKIVYTYKDISDEITNGNTLLIVDGHSEAISITTTEFEHRVVEKPTVENIIKGPKESFTESVEINRSLVRKHLKDEKLISEIITLNTKVNNEIYLMYIEDMTNPKLINDVKKRLNEIKINNVKDLSILEQHLEERPYSLVPSLIETERPDRVVSFLEEGHIALLLEGSPVSLILPITFWSLFHSPEDQYQRWAYGNFLRLIRLIACFIALLTPGVYIAISSYHIDMIPTDLVLAIAASREGLPFPAVLELLIMETAFELLREAGVRVPTPIGPTIGIVGALILGQAAVQANIVSPILVIIVSLTGLSSFAIPEQSLGFMIRIGRFIFIFSGMLLGFYGIASSFIVIIAYLVSIKSFGVPFFAPVAPHYSSSKDTIIRPPIWKEWLRPIYLNPLRIIRSKKPKGE